MSTQVQFGNNLRFLVENLSPRNSKSTTSYVMAERMQDYLSEIGVDSTIERRHKGDKCYLETHNIKPGCRKKQIAVLSVLIKMLERPTNLPIQNIAAYLKRLTKKMKKYGVLFQDGQTIKIKLNQAALDSSRLSQKGFDKPKASPQKSVLTNEERDKLHKSLQGIYKLLQRNKDYQRRFQVLNDMAVKAGDNRYDNRNFMNDILESCELVKDKGVPTESLQKEFFESIEDAYYNLLGDQFNSLAKNYDYHLIIKPPKLPPENKL